ncbi:MAG: 2-oxo acid dehydrogenase subunit E2 [Chloroflexi bacterium]|nr:2-oxo acid dehydrogenase subunit E2 [Chloroflexota bacterium]MBP7043262.1 2-oxo acid dehydrogenase subunit E2 [Chloroflexota bacterium]
MAEFIVMPKLGFDMREAVLVSWLKGIGEQVTKGEVVAEIESDKATLELEALVTGTVLKQLVNEGAVVPVGAKMAIVGEAGEDISGLAAGDETQAAAQEEAPKVDAAAEPAPAPAAAPVMETAVSAEFPGGIKATPVARRLAEEKSVDLRRVKGSGPDGRVRRSDVEAYLAAPPAAQPSAPMPVTAVPTGPETTEIPTSRLRQAIARRMTESKTSVPHFYVTSDIDMEPALALRKQINALLPEEQKVTVNDMVVKAAALALQAFPNLNAAFGGDKIVRHNRIHVGTAVAVEGGLLTIVQKNTNLTPLAQIAADNRAMIGRARVGKVKPEDVEGSTFTISNLGAFDVDSFVAIINPPDAAILAVGSAKQVPVVVNGQLAVGTRMKATISADHRVTDGAEAAQFMQTLKAILETPLRLLL